MATVTLRNLGGSIVMAVPKKILSLVELGAGSKVQVTVEGGRLIVEPAKKPRYELAELLSNCRRSDLAPLRKDRSWLETGPVGREEL
jgi:antitoxin ChpS